MGAAQDTTTCGLRPAEGEPATAAPHPTPVFRYLVVSGSGDGGRSHHGAGAFATSAEACEELDRLRLRPSVAWAEMTAVDPQGRLTLVCRFDR